MDYVILRAELDSDPLGRGYEDEPVPMTDAAVAVDMNTVYRQRNRESLSASEVYNAIDAEEYLLLVAESQTEIWNILHLGEVNPFGLEARRFTSIFGAGSATISTLQALRTEAVSRGEELGLGRIKPGHVEKARAL